MCPGKVAEGLCKADRQVEECCGGGEKKKHLSPICGEHFGRVGVRVGCALSKSGLSSRVNCLEQAYGV